MQLLQYPCLSATWGSGFCCRAETAVGDSQSGCQSQSWETLTDVGAHGSGSDWLWHCQHGEQLPNATMGGCWACPSRAQWARFVLNSSQGAWTGPDWSATGGLCSVVCGRFGYTRSSAKLWNAWCTWETGNCRALEHLQCRTPVTDTWARAQQHYVLHSSQSSPNKALHATREGEETSYLREMFLFILLECIYGNHPCSVIQDVENHFIMFYK